MSRELVVLGCASQAPTRYRNHNGYLLRWDDEAILFDPGEGTQRQMILAGVASSSITRICVTHFHGDHCLGLPGVLGRLALDRVNRPVDVYYPASGQAYFDRLRHASVSEREPDLVAHPVDRDGVVFDGPPFRLVAARLDHRTDTFGWRLEEPDGRRMLPERLEQAGIRGPHVGRLQAEGALHIRGRTVTLEQMSEHRSGQKMAFVMDTRVCAAAQSLAEGVDLLVCESTFLETEAHLAADYAHLTAAQAASLARDAGAAHLVLTHYSSRYQDESVFVAEAQPIFANTTAVKDLDVIPIRRRPEA